MSCRYLLFNQEKSHGDMHAMTSVPWQRSDVALHNTLFATEEQTEERMPVLVRKLALNSVPISQWLICYM